MKKIIVRVSFSFFLITALLVLLNVSFQDIFSLPEGFFATYEDVNSANNGKDFGNFISLSLDENETKVGSSKEQVSTVTFKLFGIFPIRKVEVWLAPDEEMYIGGVPIGFSIKTRGAIIIGENPVETASGKITTAKSIKLKSGDILVCVNDILFDTVEEIAQIIEDSNGEDISITVNRKGKNLTSVIKPEKEAVSNKYKLGLWVRDDASGIGTLTYVNKETNEYGALGHPITDFETGAIVPSESGEVYSCSTLGINKGTKGKPGELKCLFIEGKGEKGTIKRTSNFGVFGKITDKSGLVDENLTAKAGGRMGVKPGKASIVTSASGVREEYEIEIIKTNKQTKSGDKSLIFRVKDKRLLDLTGGIVQGMSGSPIMQNGKIIGAVTHVFVTDPTKGYGVYIDWMLAV